MVRYTVRWSEQSRIDLREIFEYIKKSESQERAKYVVSGVRDVANKIAPFPTKHTKEPFITDGSVRYAVKWSYKILYTIDEKHVNIARVFHTSQSPEKIQYGKK